MKTFLMQRLYRQGDTDTSVLLGGRLTLHCRPRRLWKCFDWGKWGAHTNGRVLALQTPWVTIVVSQADQGRQSEKYSKIQGKEGNKGTHP